MNEVDLIHAVKRGHNAAFTALCGVHRGMLHNLAARYARRLSFEDLLQSARLSLWRATLKYDPSKGTTLATYAARRIRADLRRCVTTWGSDMTLTDQQRQGGLTFRADHYDEVFMDGFIGADRYHGPICVENEVTTNRIRHAVATHVARLPEAEQAMLRHRWWLDATFEEVGAAEGYTKQWAKTLQERAFRKLRTVRLLARLSEEVA